MARIRKHITGNVKDEGRAEEQRAKRRREAIELATAVIEQHEVRKPKVINPDGYKVGEPHG